MSPRLGGKRTAEAAGLHTPPDSGGTTAEPFEGLRPTGAERGNAAGVIAALEAAMECRGKLHIAMSEAMGRPPMVAALCAGGSAAAVELAVADWAALLERAGGAEAVWGERRPPVGWAEAARRVVHVLTAA
eukprot:4243793-Pleurochrysis_carterae.AAC.1